VLAYLGLLLVMGGVLGVVRQELGGHRPAAGRTPHNVKEPRIASGA